jgi:serine/threonine-protein kinase
MISVPQVPSSDTAAQATQLLQAAGLTVSATAKQVGVSSNPVLGTVAGTTPAAGTSWPENKPVTLEVVAGLTLPTLVNENIESIQSYLGANHISVSASNVSSDKAAGVIVSQEPAAGTLVKPGQTVDVTVSAGPPVVTIPDVDGQSFQHAQHELEQLGFQVVGKRYFFGQKVYSTSPSGSAPAGSTITVYYGGF